MSLWQRVRRWWSHLIPYENIEEALGVTISTSQDMLDAQELWRKMFAGDAPWNDENNPSLFLAAGLCTEIARSVTIKFESEVTGSPRADFLNKQHQRGIRDLRSDVEKLCFGGTIIWRPFVLGGNIYNSTSENNCYYPIKYNELNELIEVVFADTVIQRDKYYTLLEHCIFANNTYTIEYTAYRSDYPDELGKAVRLSSVERWATLPPLFRFKNVERPWFVTIRMPQLNHIEQNSPDGAALFSKAVNLIRDADRQYGRTVWEFEGGELAVDAPSDMWRDIGRKDPLNPRNGRVVLDMPEGKKRLYRNTGIASDKLLPTVFNPDFRDASLYNGLNNICRKIEFASGLAFGIISDPQAVERTKAEVLHGRERSASTVKDIQGTLEAALRQLVAVMDDMATRYYLAPQGKYDISFFWDDSIMETSEEKNAEYNAELGRLMLALQAGLIKPEVVTAFMYENSDYLSKLTEEQIEEARAMMGSATDNGEEDT